MEASEAIIETAREKRARAIGEQAVECMERNEVLVIIPPGHLDTEGGFVVLTQNKPSAVEA